MTTSDRLFDDFRRSLNAELTALGCRLTISGKRPDAGKTMLLVAENGEELGLLPDHSDAPVIAAFEQILAKVDRPALVR